MTWISRITLALLSALVVDAFAALASVSVREVEFNRVNAQTSSSDWLKCSIEVEVRRDPQDSTRRLPDYIDDLVVELVLGIESSISGQSSFEFFKVEAALVSLKEGKHFVRFYLPPEIVERDRIRNEVHSFLIRLKCSGKVVEEQVSRRLERINVLDSFLKRVDLDSPRNDGILLPQFKTPFSVAYPNDTPSFRDSGDLVGEQG